MNISPVIERSSAAATRPGVRSVDVRSAKLWPTAVGVASSALTPQSAQQHGRTAGRPAVSIAYDVLNPTFVMTGNADRTVPATNRPPRGAPG